MVLFSHSEINFILFQDSAHEQGDSEYESADDDIEVIDEVIQGENGSGEEPYPGAERQEGDGEETPNETLDDDEDKKNPAYIPKRGMFYEHDDRIDPEDEEAEEESKEDKDKDKKKKVWKADSAERWGHDKFMEMEQTPKNEEELVAAYGYDIRNEDAAPRAGRRRRYGRGPNKYTRSWKDEDAYVKPVPAKPLPLKPGRGGKSVTIEDSRPEEYDDERQPLQREKSMTDMKSYNSQYPELKREKSAPEIRMNRLNRNSRERDEESFRNRKSDGYYNKGSDFGGRGMGPSRGRGGRGGRGGFDGMDQFRGGGRGGRGGYEDRGRGGDRRMREERGGYRGGFGDNDFRGGSRGRGGRGRGRGDLDRMDKRPMDQGPGKMDNLGEDMNNLDIKNNDSAGGNDKRGMRYSQQRRGGGGGGGSANHPLQEMYAEGIDPSLCSGPPSAPPFQNQHVSSTRLPAHSGHSPGAGAGAGPAVSSAFPGPGISQPILNYGGGPGPAQLPAIPSMPVVPGPAVTALPALPATVAAGAGQLMDPLMMAAAAGVAGDTFVSPGGVTYFNPTAQNFLPQRQVTKRAKAPIAIVDPSQKGDPAAKDYNSVNNRSLPGESNLTSENNQELTAAQ